jgi:hypothetical protein
MTSPRDRRTLVAELDSRLQSIAYAFQDATDPLSGLHLPRECPAPRDIRVATLRRLHAALSEFLVEAYADEDAKLLGG